MTNQQKSRILARRWISAKKRLLNKVPKLLNNTKLAKRRATPDPVESCLSQSDDPQACAKIVRQ